MRSDPPVTVGLLHPGQMGASVGAALAECGSEVAWMSEGRSRATIERAEAAGLRDASNLEALAERSDVIFSICPPHAASQVARAVAATGFGGVYVDANAVAPSTALDIRSTIIAAGAVFVDGDIIGGPMAPGAQTRLYLSGPDAPFVADLLAGSRRGEAVVLGADVTAASALKMTYAAWTKGTAALLMVVEAAARASGVEEALLTEWRWSQPDVAARLAAAHRSLPKAWRWSGEMDEIATTFHDAGLPDAFPRAAAEVWRILTDGTLIE